MRLPTTIPEVRLGGCPPVTPRPLSEVLGDMLAPATTPFDEVIQAHAEWAASLPALPPGYRWSFASVVDEESHDPLRIMQHMTATPVWAGI